MTDNLLFFDFISNSRYLRKALRNDSSVKIESLMKKGYVLHTEKGQENSL